MDRLRWTLVVVAAAEALIILDISFGAMVINDVQREFGSSIATVQGILAGYALVVAILTLVGGRLAGRWSSPTTMRAGLLIRAVGAAVTATALNIWAFGIGEALLAGIGMALVSPSTTSTIGSLFRGRASARAFGVIGAAIAVAGGLGPVVGGWITTHLSWRWCNWFEFGLSLALFAGSLAIPRIARIVDDSRLDWLGVVTSGLAFTAIVIGLDEIPTWGVWSDRGSPISVFGLSLAPLLVVGGLAMFVAFLAIERRRSRLGRSVLVDPALLRIGGLRAALLTTISYQAALAGLLVVVPVYLQVVRGTSAFVSGLYLLPMSITGFVAATLFPRLARRYSVRALALAAGVCMSVCAVLAYWEVDPAIWGTPLLIGLAVFGVGVSILDSELDAVAQGSVPSGREGDAAGLQCTADNFGSAIGIALVTSVMIISLSGGIVSFLNVHPGISEATSIRARSHLEGDVPMLDPIALRKGAADIGDSPAEAKVLVSAYQRSQTDALEWALLTTGALALVVILVARRIPPVPLQELEPDGEELVS